MHRYANPRTHHPILRLATLGLLMATLALFLLMFASSDALASGKVYDRGPTTHARGTVYGSTYNVMRGDTIFSIANRFGVDQYTLASVNGVHNPKYLQAGSTVTIPGIGPHPTPHPTRYPTRYPTPGPTRPPYPTPTPIPPNYQAFVTITSPTWGAQLPATFTVSGRGGRLFEGNVVVQAQDRYGNVLAERATTLQGSTGGEGSFSVQLTVQTGANTPGTIVAFSPGAAGARDTVEVVYNGGGGSSAFVSITEPTSGANLPATFIVRGLGRGLFEGNVVVQAQDWNGRTLAEVATTLQGNNVGAGGEGTWSVQLNINQSVEGRIVALSRDSNVSDSVSVYFNAGGTGPGPGPTAPMKEFVQGECMVRPRAGAPGYGYPQGPQRGTFAGNIEYDVRRGVYVEGVYWYYVDIAPGTDNPSVWVKRSDLDGERGVCTW